MAQFTTPACLGCNKTSTVELTDDEARALNSDVAIQRALPDWSADDRELLITGTHPKCWDDLFGDE